jgi:DNA-repair protein complementing XP-A cells
MPHLLKANPHKSTYSNMMLFLRSQVEDFAWKKWGSPEALDAEYEKRVSEKKNKKNKKFEEGLKELRRKTREGSFSYSLLFPCARRTCPGVWQRRKDEEHKHIFSTVENGSQVCHTCGFTIEVEEF